VRNFSGLEEFDAALKSALPDVVMGHDVYEPEIVGAAALRAPTACFVRALLRQSLKPDLRGEAFQGD
jgi:hypothetical protein